MFYATVAIPIPGTDGDTRGKVYALRATTPIKATQEAFRRFPKKALVDVHRWTTCLTETGEKKCKETYFNMSPNQWVQY